MKTALCIFVQSANEPETVTGDFSFSELRSDSAVVHERDVGLTDPLAVEHRVGDGVADAALGVVDLRQGFQGQATGRCKLSHVGPGISFSFNPRARDKLFCAIPKKLIFIRARAF